MSWRSRQLQKLFDAFLAADAVAKDKVTGARAARALQKLIREIGTYPWRDPPAPVRPITKKPAAPSNVVSFAAARRKLASRRAS